MYIRYGGSLPQQNTWFACSLNCLTIETTPHSTNRSQFKQTCTETIAHLSDRRTLTHPVHRLKQTGFDREFQSSASVTADRTSISLVSVVSALPNGKLRSSDHARYSSLNRQQPVTKRLTDLDCLIWTLKQWRYQSFNLCQATHNQDEKYMQSRGDLTLQVWACSYWFF
jgi:hypothetical protein